MIRRLLDTNAVIALVRRRSEALLYWVESTETGSLTVSSVVAHELHCGVYRSRIGFPRSRGNNRA